LCLAALLNHRRLQLQLHGPPHLLLLLLHWQQRHLRLMLLHQPLLLLLLALSCLLLLLLLAVVTLCNAPVTPTQWLTADQVTSKKSLLH
jgi:hypothetical protein